MTSDLESFKPTKAAGDELAAYERPVFLVFFLGGCVKTVFFGQVNLATDYHISN